ncbi:MAG: MnmC family methyltransferase [Bdellovibrionia bacterium]
MPYQLEKFKNGQTSLSEVGLKEPMHSWIGPWEEANLIYIGQSRLQERLALASPHPLVVWDVGLGIGANAIALLQATFNLNPARSLHLLSFEKDLRGLSFALEHREHFPFLNPFTASLQAISKGCRELQLGPKVLWQIVPGDFAQILIPPSDPKDQPVPPHSLGTLPRPELIYYDFFSPQSLPSLWSLQMFRTLFEKTQLQTHSPFPTELITYSCATAVRSALILAGFYVGAGVKTPAKKETTVASTSAQGLTQPLDPSWVEHLKRSSKPLPLDHGFKTEDQAILKIKERLLEPHLPVLD